MEELKEAIILYWPTIVQYALMIFAYFLVFLYRSKVNGTSLNFTTLFKEKTQEFIASNSELQKSVNTELVESKAAYQAAIDKIKSLEEKTLHLEKALLILTEEVKSDAELYKDESD